MENSITLIFVLNEAFPKLVWKDCPTTLILNFKYSLPSDELMVEKMDGQTNEPSFCEGTSTVVLCVFCLTTLNV